MDEPVLRNVELSVEGPVQFGIRDLLIAQAVCAFCLGLFAVAGTFALLAILIATLVFCAVRVQPIRRKLKRCIIDLMGGVALPAMCLVYDPFVFRASSADRSRIPVLVAVICEMLILAIWIVCGRGAGRWSALFAGMLTVGAVVAGGIGAMLAPLGLIGLVVFGLGLLLMTPFLTCVVFSRNAIDAMRQARKAGGKWDAWLLFATGALLAAAVPVVIALCFGPSIETAFKALPHPREPWLGRLFEGLHFP
jgi:hypothetical protein